MASPVGDFPIRTTLRLIQTAPPTSPVADDDFGRGKFATNACCFFTLAATTGTLIEVQIPLGIRTARRCDPFTGRPPNGTFQAWHVCRMTCLKGCEIAASTQAASPPGCGSLSAKNSFLRHDFIAVSDPTCCPGGEIEIYESRQQSADAMRPPHGGRWPGRDL